MARLADTLTEAGHNVTFLAPVVDASRKGQMTVTLTKDVIVVEQDEEMKSQVKPIDGVMGQYWKADIDSTNADKIFSTFTHLKTLSCSNFLRHRKIHADLESRNFDVGIFEPVSVCGLGFFSKIKIEKIIMASSCSLHEIASFSIGEPINPNFVPGMMSKSMDNMHFWERLENFKMSKSIDKMQSDIYDRESALYRQFLGNDLPDWRELLPTVSFFFTNSIPYVDFPRTVTQKTIPIGGISVDIQSIIDSKLSIEWSDLLEKRPHNMLISFGSMVRSMDMPLEWRNGLLSAIKSFPNVTFIWKYESDDVTFAESFDNIHLSKWVPQTGLLNDKRLNAFMTHGGLGSTNELAFLGKPSIMIPVFADQDRNAKMLERHGGVILLKKRDLENDAIIRNSIQNILFQEKFKRNSEKLADILRNQPMKPKEQVVKYTEFVAKFGPFPRMDPYSRHLGFIERNSIDIYLYLYFPYILITIIIFIIFWMILMKNGKKQTKNE